MASSSRQPSSRPASRSPSPSRVLTSLDVQQGNILWLAPKQETLASLRRRSQYASEPVHNIIHPGIVPDDGFYGHPILVISRPSTLPETIHFLHLTTFSGQKLEKRFRKGSSVANRRNYMTMAPGSSHPLLEAGDQMYRVLQLENGEAMARRGYVNISEVYSMNWRDAQPFWRGDPSQRQRTRLDTSSLQLLLFATQHVGQYTPDEQHVPSQGGSRRSSSKSPVHDTIAAAKAPQQRLSPRPSSLPERGKPPSLKIPVADSPLATRVPQTARARTAASSLPATRRTSPAEGSRSSGWDEERQALLASRRNGSVVRSDGDVEADTSYARWVFMRLKNAVVGTFRFLWFLVRFIARVVFR